MQVNPPRASWVSVLLSPRAVAVAVAVPLLACAGLVLGAPLWSSWGLSEVVREAFGPFCHQRIDRSFSIGGAVLPVCARCTGLWVGAAGAAVLVPWLTRPRALPSPWLLVGGALPMALDVGAGALGAPSNGIGRALTGLILGGTLVVFLFPMLLRAADEVRGATLAKKSPPKAQVEP